MPRLILFALALALAGGPARAQDLADDDPGRGPLGAPVTIVEFCDYECDLCAQMEPVLRRVEAAYGDAVRVVYRDFPLKPRPEGAAEGSEAAACAGEQGRFWQMHARIFATPDALYDTTLRRHAAAIGLDIDRFMRCLRSGRHEAEWQKDKADGVALGVTGTPTIFVNGQFAEGLMSAEEVGQFVEAALGR